MTVSTAYSGPQTSACDGSTTSFPVAFQYADKSGLVVELVDDASGNAITLTEGTDYTRSGDGMAAPSSITTLAVYPAGKSIRRRRATPRLQSLLAPPNSLPPAAQMERAWDRAVLAVQEIDAELGVAFAKLLRTWLVPEDGSQDGKYPVVLPGGGLGYASGTGVDGALRTDIALPTGAQFMGFRGRSAFDKLSEWPSVEDAGATGDGVTDDGDAINLALATYKCVRFLPGRTYYTSKDIVVPPTCRRIHGQGAIVKGPGAGSTVDGFHFEGFNQGPNTFPTWHRNFVSRSYELPGLYDFRRAISIVNAAFLPISSDIIGFCYDAIYIEATAGANSWSVQNIVRADLVQQCENVLHLVTVSGSVEGIQGCDVHVPYASGNGCGIRGTFDGAGANINFNIFRFGNLDGNGRLPSAAFAVNFSHELNTTINTFLFDNEPINMNPIGASSPYVNINQQEVVESGRFLGNGFAPYNYEGFLPGGYRTTAEPGAGTMTIHVNAGVATTGIGSAASPYKTIAEAVSALQEMDGFGYTCVVSLAAGTYSEAVLIDTRTAGSGNWRIILQPTSGTVTLTGGVSVVGPSYVILQNLTMTTKAISASVNAHVGVNGLTFGAAPGQSHMVATLGALIEVQSSYTISGGGAAHVQADRGGRIVGVGRSVTVTGAPAFSTAFALAGLAGSLIDFGGSSFTGAATGARYSATGLAQINTGGGGAAFFPGSAAGSVLSGGQYT